MFHLELENLERCCQLHEHVEIIYVVDGYQASLETENFPEVPLIKAHGTSFVEALIALDKALEGKTLEQVRRNKL